MTWLKLAAVRLFLPAAVRWVEVRERVRVLEVDSVWGEEGGVMMRIARWLGFCDPRTHGLCCRYGVLVLRGLGGYRQTVLHECVHTGQYERPGGVRPFLAAYLRECVVDGYPDGVLEREAIERSEALI